MKVIQRKISIAVALMLMTLMFCVSALCCYSVKANEPTENVGVWGRDIKITELAGEAKLWNPNVAALKQNIVNNKAEIVVGSADNAIYSNAISVNFDKSPTLEINIESFSGDGSWYLYTYANRLNPLLAYSKTIGKEVGKVVIDLCANAVAPLSGTQQVMLYLGFYAAAAGDKLVINSMKTQYGTAWGDETSNTYISSWTKTGAFNAEIKENILNIEATSQNYAILTSPTLYIDLANNPYVDIDVMELINANAPTEYTYWSADLQYSDNTLEIISAPLTVAKKIRCYPTGITSGATAFKGGQKVKLNLRVQSNGAAANPGKLTAKIGGIQSGYLKTYQDEMALGRMPLWNTENAVVAFENNEASLSFSADNGKITSLVSSLDLDLGNTLELDVKSYTEGAQYCIKVIYDNDKVETLVVNSSIIGKQKFELKGDVGNSTILTGKQRVQIQIETNKTGSILVLSDISAGYLKLWGEGLNVKSVENWLFSGGEASYASDVLTFTPTEASKKIEVTSGAFTVDLTKNAYFDINFKDVVNAACIVEIAYGDGSKEVLTLTNIKGANHFELAGSTSVKEKSKANIVIKISPIDDTKAFSASLQDIKAGNVLVWQSEINMFEVSKMWTADKMKTGMKDSSLTLRAIVDEAGFSGSITSGYITVDLSKKAVIEIDVSSIKNAKYCIVAILVKDDGRVENVNLKYDVTAKGKLVTSPITNYTNLRGVRNMQIQLWVNAQDKDNEVVVDSLFTKYVNDEDIAKLPNVEGTQSISGNIFYVLQDSRVKNHTYKVVKITKNEQNETVETEVIAPFTTSKLYYDFTEVALMKAGSYKLIIVANPTDALVAKGVLPSDPTSFDINKQVYLQTPEIAINGSIIKWSAVENSSGYILIVKQKEVILEKTRLSFALEFDASHLVKGMYRIEVEAIGDGKLYISKKSSAIFNSTFVPKEYVNVTFNSDGVNVKRNKVEKGTAAEAHTTTKEGFRFDGWFTSADNGVTLSQTAFDFSKVINEPITLYAKWTEITADAPIEKNSCGSFAIFDNGGGAAGCIGLLVFSFLLLVSIRFNNKKGASK